MNQWNRTEMLHDRHYAAEKVETTPKHWLDRLDHVVDVSFMIRLSKKENRSRRRADRKRYLSRLMDERNETVRYFGVVYFNERFERYLEIFK